MDTDIKHGLAEGDSDATKIANILISQAGTYLGRVKVEGTLEDPKYRLVAKPINELFGDKLKGLLKNIFE